MDKKAEMPPYDKQYKGNLLELALDIGAGLLRSGAEIHRVEDTMERICLACGAESADVFVITSLISLTLHMPGNRSMSQTRRVSGSGNHLERIEQLNALSRSICSGELTVEQALQRERAILKGEDRRGWLLYLGAFLAAGGFAVFFGGRLLDGLLAGGVGLLLMLLQEKRPAWMNEMVQAALSSFLAGSVTLLLRRLGLPLQADKIMIGAVMLLIPGLSWGNALRELLVGDTISGSLRVIQSVLLAVMIAFGFAASFYMLGGVL